MIYRGLCTACVHFAHDDETGDPVCAAFPGGIPDEIIRLGFDHRNEYPGDNDVRFEPAGPVDVEWIERIVSGGGVRDDRPVPDDSV